MITLKVTVEQAKVLAQAEQVAARAVRERTAILDLLSLGHGLEGYALCDINTNTGELSFSPPEVADG